MTDTPKKTLTLKRKSIGTGSKPGTVSRSGKRIIKRDDLPRAKPAKAPPKKPTNQKKKPARVSKPKMAVSPSDLRARELYQRLNDFEVWRSYKPLALGVEKAIFKICNDGQFPGGSKKVVQKVLRMHTGRDVYRINVSRRGKRYRLDAKEGGEVTGDQIAHAAKALKAG